MSIAPPPARDALHHRLTRFLDRPQRHRLLHGYPLAAAMPFVDEELRRRIDTGNSEAAPTTRPDVGTLVGVLPHPFCNPKISGCGFCTFPHESFSSARSSLVVQALIQEIEDRLRSQPEISRRKISGLYFGGGTANLTPATPFRQLARKLSHAFDPTDAEISLEGVPAYFVKRRPLLIDIMREEMPARHFRISMGMQTFSEKRLREMGRLAFGRANTFAEVVDLAHHRGMTISGDLLFNLPGQTLKEMQDDVHRAIEIGLDQICLYHLVMFRGLGTAWSKDETMLARLPTNVQAADHWLHLRDQLICHGYRQTTLTNFERTELANDARRYQYELMSFQPDRYQMLGFGPAGISYADSDNDDPALKTMNPESSAEYLQAVRSGRPVWNRYFRYQAADKEILHLTRRLAALQIETERFRQAFGMSVWDRYSEPLELLAAEGLITWNDDAIAVTPRGMFYADSIAGLLTETRLRMEGPGSGVPVCNDNSHGHM